jgi:glyoxylase-like metal-dependent hydrolase (beta-lactamase superfamily II)
MRLTDHLYLVGSGHFGLSQAFDCSVYAVDCGGELALVDSGAGVDVEALISNLEHDGLDPARIRTLLLTHSHSDHAGGAHVFRERYGCRVHISRQEAEIVERGDEIDLGLDMAKRSGLYAPDYQFPHCPVDVRLDDNDVIRCGSREFHAFLVPGHSEGSLCFQVDLPEGRALFSGDVVFAEGTILLLNSRGSSLSEYRSCIGRLADRKVDILLPGHKVFVLSGGQGHIDQAIEHLGRIQLPQNLL